MSGTVMGVGIIGAGNISESYLKRAPLFNGIEVRAVADLNRDRAAARASEFAVRAETVEGILAADDIDIIVNLTVPAAHYSVTCAILDAGKHAFSEKPLSLTLTDARDIAAHAEKAGLRVGCAPDTFLGGSHQESRRLVDEGAVGRIVHGTCHVMGAGMEGWHPDPDFFFLKGGGPILDMGAYYVTQLINLIGPVARVSAMTGVANETRTIGSAARKGEVIPVEVPTTAHALLEFRSGAIITLGASWDVKGHGHRNVELYGTEATLVPQDPNFFGGVTEVIRPGGARETYDAADHPLAVPNCDTTGTSPRADYRTAGLADMADAIRGNRPHRCSLDRALHVTEVLESILISGEEKRFVPITTTCSRPEPLGAQAARALMKVDALV